MSFREMIMAYSKDDDFLNYKTRGVNPPMTVTNYDPFDIDSELRCLISISGNMRNELFDFEEKKKQLLDIGLVKEGTFKDSSRKLYIVESTRDVIAFLTGYKIYRCVYTIQKMPKEGLLNAILYGYGFKNGIARKGCFPARILRFFSKQQIKEMDFEIGNAFVFFRDYGKKEQKGTFEDEINSISEALLQKRKAESLKDN